MRGIALWMGHSALKAGRFDVGAVTARRPVSAMVSNLFDDKQQARLAGNGDPRFELSTPTSRITLRGQTLGLRCLAEGRAFRQPAQNIMRDQESKVMAFEGQLCGWIQRIPPSSPVPRPELRLGFPRLAVLSGVVLALLGGGAQASRAQSEARTLSEQQAHVVGADACKSCHLEIHAKWDTSRHSKMVQPATRNVVKGDFNRKRVFLRGQPYGFRVSGDKYYITESFILGDTEEHQVQYTLGSRRIQHYLTTLADGRIVVLPPTWDVLREEWFHNLEIAAQDRREDSGGTPIQVWNKNCFGCHVSEEVKNFDADNNSYETAWLDFGTNCERCHGPGSVHVERYEQEDAYREDPNGYIVVPNRLDPTRSSMVCAQCHSFRDVMATGFTAGEDYYDHFLPLLEYSEGPTTDPVWYADGKTRRFSTNALGFWQSECFNRGQASCLTCHVEMHEPEIEEQPQLEARKTSLCTRCHESIGEDVAAHTFHPENSPGSSCVECHMPKSVTSIRTTMRDHSISVPVPENTIRFDTPNACNICHEDEDAKWARKTLERWYPDSVAGEKLVRRTAAFVAAKKGDTGVVPELVALANSHEQDPINRANAVGYLGNYPSQETLATLSQSLTDAHPLVRAVAALKVGDMGDVDVERARQLAIAALGDDKHTVRMNAAVSLLNLGIHTLGGEEGERFETAKKSHTERGAFHGDDAPQQLNLGRFHVLNGDGMNAARAFDQSHRLDPKQPGIKYFLAITRLAQKRVDEAKNLLKDVPRNDPFRKPARDLLKKLP